MRLESELKALGELKGPVALAIGVFDGMHRGHQEVVRAAVEHARQHEGTAVVVTFDPHPAAVLSPGREPPLLTTPGHRRRLAAGLGAEHLLALRFTKELAAMEAEPFLEGLVRACRPLGCVSVGYEWRFGRGGAGDVHMLMDAGSRHGFAVYGVPPIGARGGVISSTRVREAVSSGELEAAAELLGRPFGYLGEVVHGRQLGRTIGFPTANVRLETQVHPPAGVYVCEVGARGERHAGVCNLGRRPTVEAEGKLALEAHLLDWQGDLYGEEIEVRLMERLRGEQAFGSLGELTAQIGRDAAAARAFWNLRGKD
jgi:riboflavin kinase / FMN adenylyltransferase